MMEIASKKRKIPSSTTSFHQLRKAPRLRFNPTLDRDSASSCSSSGSDMRIQNLDLEDESGSVIVEVEASMCYSERERKSETTAFSEVEEEEEKDTSSSEKLDSSREKAVNSHGRSNKKKDNNSNMPTESELEEFFSQAEKKLHKQFANKYNYDVVKDVPLQGRYEWLKLKP